MKKYLNKILFLFIGLTLAATASYLNAWSGPPTGVTPPDGNVEAPINIGITDQTKTGSFTSATILAANTLMASNEICFGLDCRNSWAAVGGVPSGSISYIATTTCPTGYLLANGASVSKTTYASLYAVIGTTFGSTATNFSLPDLRGYFIRSYGTNTDGTASGTFGAKQGDAFKSHTHTGTTNSAGAHTHSYNWEKTEKVAAGSNSTDGRNGGARGQTTGSAGAHTHTVSITANTDGGGTETRPDNIALTACIKI